MEAAPAEPKALALDRCDGVFGGDPHWTRQSCRLVRFRWQENGSWEVDTRSLCMDHYRELRAQTEPRHPAEPA